MYMKDHLMNMKDQRSFNEQVKYSQLMRNHITGEHLIKKFVTTIVICHQRGDEKIY